MSGHLGRGCPNDDDSAAQARERVQAALDARTAARMVALRRVTFVPASPDKRFVRDVCGVDVVRLSARQREHVDRLAWRYRRQLPAGVPPRVNPDDPIVRMLAERDLGEIDTAIAEAGA